MEGRVKEKHKKLAKQAARVVVVLVVPGGLPIVLADLLIDKFGKKQKEKQENNPSTSSGQEKLKDKKHNKKK